MNMPVVLSPRGGNPRTHHTCTRRTASRRSANTLHSVKVDVRVHGRHWEGDAQGNGAGEPQMVTTPPHSTAESSSSLSPPVALPTTTGAANTCRRSPLPSRGKPSPVHSWRRRRGRRPPQGEGRPLQPLMGQHYCCGLRRRSRALPPAWIAFAAPP